MEESLVELIFDRIPGIGWYRWGPERPAPADQGIYVVFYELHQTHTIRVGALGQAKFVGGIYVYVGSAQGGLAARLNRHGGRRKTKRWHIDYFAAHAQFAEALVLPAAGKAWECCVARALRECFRMPLRGFGASDCQCESHLVRICTNPE